MDLQFYKKRIDICKERLEEIHLEKSVMAYPHINYGERLYGRDPYRTLFNSKKYISLLEEEAELENKIQVYCAIIKNTEGLLEKVDQPARDILKDIYIEEMPSKSVAMKYYYSDEKSMYRVVRKTLKKSIFQESGH